MEERENVTSGLDREERRDSFWWCTRILLWFLGVVPMYGLPLLLRLEYYEWKEWTDELFWVGVLNGSLMASALLCEMLLPCWSQWRKYLWSDTAIYRNSMVFLVSWPPVLSALWMIQALGAEEESLVRAQKVMLAKEGFWVYGAFVVIWHLFNEFVVVMPEQLRVKSFQDAVQQIHQRSNQRVDRPIVEV